MFAHILLPVDPMAPEVAAPAMALARRLALRADGAVTVVAVVSAWPDDLAKVPSDYGPWLDAYVDAHRGTLDMTPLLRVGGSVSGRILEAADETGAECVVMASHDPRITDALIGSNASHVVLHARCSVPVVRDAAADHQKPEEPMFKHILVPVDLDHLDTSAKAMEVARGIARAEGAALTVISVQPMIAEQTDATHPDYEARLKAYVEGLEGGPRARAELRIGGSVSGEIRYAAQELAADLIVMASHDPRITDYLIGSNAAHVALHTPCSVLVVR